MKKCDVGNIPILNWLQDMGRIHQWNDERADYLTCRIATFHHNRLRAIYKFHVNSYCWYRYYVAVGIVLKYKWMWFCVSVRTFMKNQKNIVCARAWARVRIRWVFVIELGLMIRGSWNICELIWTTDRTLNSSRNLCSLILPKNQSIKCRTNFLS